MLIIGIAGGSGSGKSSLIKLIKKQLPGQKLGVLSLDSYYCDNTKIPMNERANINFDHPDAFDFALLTNHIQQLRKGNAIYSPVYSYKEMTRVSGSLLCKPYPILIVEGLFTFYHYKLASLLDKKIYLTVHKNERLRRIRLRDVNERGRTILETEQRFSSVVNPMHVEFVEKQKYLADYIIDNSGNIRQSFKQLVRIINQNQAHD